MSVTCFRVPQILWVVFLLGCQSYPIATLAADRSPPEAQIVSPQDGATVAGPQVLCSVDAWDESGVRKVRFYVNGKWQTTVKSEPFTWKWDTTGLEDGEYVLRARVFDRRRNRTDREIRVTVANNTPDAIDETAPQAEIVSPEANATVAGSQVVFAVDTWDESGVRKVKFDVDESLQAEITSEPFIWEWDTTRLEDGEYTLRARVYDMSYNRTDREIRVTVANNAADAIDETAPQAEIVSPEANATVAGSQVVFAVDTWDENGVRKVKFDVDESLQAEITSEPFIWKWDTTGVEDGEYTLRARVYDMSYNRTDREIRVRVDNHPSDTPEWARHAFDALQSYKHVVDYWVGRVASDTSTDYFDVGGGWNDDVELSQSLMAYWLLTGDDALADLFRDMADRIRDAPYIGYKGAPWTQPGDRRIEQAYSTVALDADHSAEETTLVFPRLFLVDYGEPTTVEMMTRLIWNLQDNMDAEFPGEQNWGQWVDTGLLMRSPRFNARNVDWCWRPDGDLVCFAPQDAVNNFRTTAPGLSLAWYYGPDHYLWQNGPAGLMRAHHMAWIEASLREDGTKPTLIPPSKILVPSLDFGDWTVNNADTSGGLHGWVEGAWVFRHFYHAMIANHLLYRSHADSSLQAMASNADAIVYRAYSDRQYGRQVPVVNENFSLDRQFLQWRAERGPTPEDDRLLSVRAGKSPNTRIMAYLIGVEREDLVSALSNATDAYRQLSEYLALKRLEWTTGLIEGETGLTDRVKFDFSDAFLMAALGGSGIYDGAYPTIYYSLEDTDAQVVTLAKDRDSRDTSFWIYNFGSERQIGLKLWRLEEGNAQLTLGPDRDQDGQMDSIARVSSIDAIRRGIEVPLTVPGGVPYLVRIEVTDPQPRDLAGLPDLAIGRKDYAYADGNASVRVHNIGSGAVSAVVRLYDTSGVPIGPDKTVDLSAFKGMAPVIQDLTWSNVASNNVGWVVVDPDGQRQELTELNNVLTVNGQGPLPRP